MLSRLPLGRAEYLAHTSLPACSAGSAQQLLAMRVAVINSCNAFHANAECGHVPGVVWSLACVSAGGSKALFPLLCVGGEASEQTLQHC